ncbi:MAG: ribonucleoside triphosphate reductase, partial [Atopobium sp.]|nr:ribonucleoside triphosphate reductase [Atopobium sp.]
TYRLAKHDKEKWPDIITANMNGTPYYTNSSHLPVGYTDDVFTALDIEDPLQCLYTSGTVFHTFLGERLSGWKAAATLVKKIADNYKLPYYTISPTYSVYPNDGYISGEVWKCPKCGAETEVYSRITGYYRPVKNWNAGKSQEFKDRRTYKVEGLESRPVSDFENQTEKAPVSVEKAAASGKPDQVLLFTTKTCPNCKMIEGMLDKMGFQYQVVDAEEHTDLVKQYGIMQAPTLVMVHGTQADTFVNASNILKFVNESARA